MKYKVISFIRVDSEFAEVHNTKESAEKEKEHCDFLHPDDIHQIEEIEE